MLVFQGLIIDCGDYLGDTFACVFFGRFVYHLFLGSLVSFSGLIGENSFGIVLLFSTIVRRGYSKKDGTRFMLFMRSAFLIFLTDETRFLSRWTRGDGGPGGENESVLQYVGNRAPSGRDGSPHVATNNVIDQRPGPTLTFLSHAS